MSRKPAPPERERRPVGGSTAANEHVQGLLSRVTPEQLRTIELAKQSVGGYRREDVDGLLELAARTIDDLAVTVDALQHQLAKARSKETSLAEQLEQARQSNDQEVTGDVLVMAHQAAQHITEAARRDAENILKEATAEVARTHEEAAERMREAQLTVTHGDAPTAGEDDLRRGQVARLDTGSAHAWAQVEAESARLAALAVHLRDGWVELISDALSRLDRVGLDPEADPSATLPPNGLVGALHERIPGTAAVDEGS